MKKLLALLVVLLGAFSLVACFGGNTTTTTQKAADTTTTAEDLSENVKAYVKNLYLSKAKNTADDFDVIGKATVQGQTFDLEWAVTVEEGGNAEDVKVTKNEDGTKWVIDVNEDALVDTNYTLTCTVKGTDKTVSFRFMVPKFKLATYVEWLAGCKDGKTQMAIKGYVVAVVAKSSSSGGSIYLQDADGHGYYAYAPATDTEVAYGDEIIVKGTGTVYGGQYEFNKGCTYTKTGEKVTTITPNNGTADWAAADKQSSDTLIKYQNALVKLEGCTMANVDGAYYYFTVGTSTTKFNMYDTYYFLTTEQQKALTDQWEAGKTFDITGLVSCYSNLYQIYPISDQALTNVALPTKTDAEAVAIVKENLEFALTKVSKETTEKVPVKGYGEQVTIAWSCDKDLVTFDATKGELTFTQADDDTEVTLTATLTAGEATDTVTFTVLIEGAGGDEFLPNPVQAPAAGDYVFMVDSTAVSSFGGGVFYADGTLNKNGALVMTDKASKAAKFTIAPVDGKEGVYTISFDGKYLTAYRNGTYNNMKFDETPYEWTWNADSKVFVGSISYKKNETDTEDTVITVYFGTYAKTDKNTGAVTGVTTASSALSELKYIQGETNAPKVGVTQFPAQLCTLKPADYKFVVSTAPAAGDYVFMVDSTAVSSFGGGVFYADGTLNKNGALVMTDKASKAAKFTIAPVDGKEGVYTISFDGKYLTAYRNGTYNNMKFDETPYEWTWNADSKVFVGSISYKKNETDTEDTVITVYFGTYAKTDKNTGAVTGVTTASSALSELKYIQGETNAPKVGVTQFPAYFGTLEFVTEE